MQLLCENRCALSQIKIGNSLVSVTFCRFYQFFVFVGFSLKLPLASAHAPDPVSALTLR
jgi:hypothetical protein